MRVPAAIARRATLWYARVTLLRLRIDHLHGEGNGIMALTYRVKPGKSVSLAGIDPGSTEEVARADAETRLAALGPRLTSLQEMQYAAGQQGILIVLQGLDTAGKDGTIRRVMAQFNPASCRVEAFKVPTANEQAHDFLWRIHAVTPRVGEIAIFNRSHYEDILAVRVQNLAPEAVWAPRYEQINAFESLLAVSGTIVIKFFLHVSKHEQRDRLLAREADKDKAWKLSNSDWPTHALYGRYIEAYEEVLGRCSTAYAPWYIVPADHKWFRNLAVAQTIVDLLDPHAADWKAALEKRGAARLADRAAQRVAAPPPSQE